ncbi:hypothetical protein, partial [Tenacibaculum geojense]
SAPDQTVTIADGGNGNVTVGGTYPNFTIDVPNTVENTVTTSATAPTGPIEGDVWFDTSTSPTTVRIWDDSAWLSISDISNNWLLNGNTGSNNTNFLGTIDDVRMQIRSNNTPILEFGRRQTLGLDQAYPDYTNINQYLVYLTGDNATGTSALQFRADGASFYKPMFFTTQNGNFRLKGSTGVTDLFEIGSAGPDNDGRLEFIIGDDGNEPIIFKRYDYRSGGFHKEFFRVQGSNNTENAKTRFGININTNNVAVDSDYNDPQTTYNVANSTLQVEGSVSKSLVNVNSGAGAFNLTEDHHTVILSTNRNIILPNANTCNGRIYVIKNVSGTNVTSSNFLNQQNVVTNSINNNSTIWLQSEGNNWQLISESTQSSANVYTGFFIISTAGTQNITGLPFQPSQITFVAHANVESLDINSDNGVGNNARGISNSYGSMNGFARNNGGSITQQVIYVGGSGNSINDISRFASSSSCIGLRYSDQNGNFLGSITANLAAFNADGFSLNVTYTNGSVTANSGNPIQNVQPNDVQSESVVVLYTAYR